VNQGSIHDLENGLNALRYLGFGRKMLAEDQSGVEIRKAGWVQTKYGIFQVGGLIKGINEGGRGILRGRSDKSEGKIEKRKSPSSIKAFLLWGRKTGR